MIELVLYIIDTYTHSFERDTSACLLLFLPANRLLLFGHAHRTRWDRIIIVMIITLVLSSFLKKKDIMYFCFWFLLLITMMMMMKSDLTSRGATAPFHTGLSTLRAVLCVCGDTPGLGCNG